MSLLKDLDELDTKGKKGDWCFINNDTYIALIWGDDSFSDMVILPIQPTQGKLHWQWNGDKDKPTLSPSILTWKKDRNKPL